MIRWLRRRTGLASAAEACGGHDAQHHHHATLFALGPASEVDIKPICFWIAVLAVFTTVFEAVEEHLHHHTDATRKQIVEKVQGELTLMGFLGFTLSMLEQLVEIPHDAKLSFEFAHTLLFFMALTSFCMALFLLAGADRIKRKVHEVESVDQEVVCAGPRPRGGGGDSTSAKRLELAPWRFVARFLGYRRRFLSREKLPLSVDFAAYFADCTYVYVMELVEVPLAFKFGLVSTCLGAVVLPRGVAAAIDVDPDDELVAFVACGWLVCFAQVFLYARGAARLARLNAAARLESDEDLLRAMLLDRDERSHPRAADPKAPAPEHADHDHKHDQGHEKEGAGDVLASSLVGLRSLLFALFIMRYANFPQLPAGWTQAQVSAACLLPLAIASATLVDHVSKSVLFAAITSPDGDLVDKALERANAAARDVSEYRAAFVAFWRTRPDRSEEALEAFFRDCCAGPEKDKATNPREAFARRPTLKRFSFLRSQSLDEDDPVMHYDAFLVLLGSLEKTRVSRKFASRLFAEMAVDTEMDYGEFKSYLVGRGKFSAIGAHADDIFGPQASSSPEEATTTR